MKMEPNKGVSDSDIKAIESEVVKRQAQALKDASDTQAKEIETRVRKEMEIKLESDKLKEQVDKQNEEIKKLQTEQETKLKSQQEAFEKRLQELEAVRKGTVNTQSPFDNKPNPNIKVIDGKEIDTTNLDLKEIEKQSAEEFRRYHNLPNWYFKK
jgi:TolA-binding protein